MIKLLTLPRITVSTTAQAVASGQKIGVAATLYAAPTNAGAVYIGDSTVNTTDGIPLPPGASMSVEALTDPRSGAELRVNDLYCVGTNTDLLYVLYQKRVVT